MKTYVDMTPDNLISKRFTGNLVPPLFGVVINSKHPAAVYKFDSKLTMDDEVLQRVYAWVDEIPLSRPRRNITRDFSDGGNL